jgi:D-alanyl-D-alanine-carboxypeptidase/D-alanyl-D-alanine-endopeptidase
MSMQRRRALTSIVAIVAVVGLVSAQSPSSPPATAAPSDAEIRKILVERVDTQRQSVGIVVGVVDSSGRRVVSHGRRAVGDTAPLDGDTLFEIGSVTKVFTSLLLADAVARKEVALTDTVASLLPTTAKVPSRGRAITLEDLATHTSGLPRLPSNMSPKNPENPYADYTAERLYEFLSGYELTRDVGARYEYSNFGVGLLGLALARRAGTSYEALVKSRITGPLGMSSTVVSLTPEFKARMARGHTPTLQPAPNWDLDALAGAGALRSSANDLLTLLSAFLGYTKAPLAPAMAAMLAPRRPTGQGTMEIALGWHIFMGTASSPSGIMWHNGGTGGYRSFIGYNPTTRIGVVALANASTTIGTDDIGRHLLDRSSPLVSADSPMLKPPVARTQVAVDPSILPRYVGRYQFAPTVFLTVTQKDRQLFVQLTGQAAYEVYPESPTKFFLKVVDAQVSFESDADGKVTAAILHQNGRDQRAARVE